MTCFYGHPRRHINAARVANKAPCITQVTFELVHYALLINQLRLGLTFLKVLVNFRLTNMGWILVFQLRLYNVSGVLVLEGYDDLSHIISRQSSRNLQTLELIKVLMAELIRW